MDEHENEDKQAIPDPAEPSPFEKRLEARSLAKKRKQDRENDVRYQEMKAKWQKSRKEAYQKQKEKNKAFKLEKKKEERQAKLDARKKKDEELFQSLKQEANTPASRPEAPIKPNLRIIYPNPDDT